MSKMVFQQKTDSNIVTHQTDTETWPELVEEFIQFLRGCGYMINEVEFDELEEDDG